MNTDQQDFDSQTQILVGSIKESSCPSKDVEEQFFNAIDETLFIQQVESESHEQSEPQADNQPQKVQPNCLICPCCLEDQSHFNKIPLKQQLKYPFNCIGKVIIFTPNKIDNSVKQQTHVTGFLIANGIVMTAASCLVTYLSLNNGQYPERLIFFQIWDHKGLLRWYKVKLWLIHSKYLEGVQAYDEDSHDLALLLLEQSSVLLKRQLKISFQQEDYTKLRILFCPSNDSEIFKKYPSYSQDDMQMMEKEDIEEKESQSHMQLMGNNYFSLENFTCQGNCEQNVVQGFAGSPLLRQFYNQEGQINYEVVGLLRKYQTLFWFPWIRALFHQEDNSFLDFCKIIVKNCSQTRQNLAKEIHKLQGKLMVFECSSNLGQNVGLKMRERIDRQCHQ